MNALETTRRAGNIRSYCIGTVALLLLLPSFPALAQESSPQIRREGFTILLSLGPGWQKDVLFDESAIGLGGLNLGIGGFISGDAALLFRFTGTNVILDLHEEYSDPISGIRSDFNYELNQVSGVVAISIQYWINDRINVEGGPGLGFRGAEGAQERSLGLFLGIGFVLHQFKKSNFQLGIEFAPAFTDPKPVYNLGLVAGWQFL